MATLNLRIDPRQMETGADRAERALDGVQREARQTESAIDRMASRGGRSTRQLGGAVQGMGARMQAARGSIQNTAFQLGDFATQVGAGTSASVALGQQLPQLLGGFGALGAVMGAVVAVGVPLAANFLDLGSSAEETAKKVDELQDAVDRLAEATRRASREGIDDLKERYGELTVQVLALAEAERQLSLVQASRELRALQEELAGFTDVGWIDSLRGFVGNAEGEIRKIQHEFEITREEAERLKASFDDVASAESPRELSAAYGQVRDLLVDAAGGWQNLTEEQVQFISNLNSAQDAAERMADAVDDGATAMSGAEAAAQALRGTVDGVGGAMDAIAGMNISGPFETALNAAVRLFNQAKQIAEIRSGPLSFGQTDLDGPSLVRDPRTGEYVTSGQTGVTQQPGGNLPYLTVPDAPSGRVSSRGGGGGGRSASSAADDAERLADAYDRLMASLDPLERASQDLAEAQETINAAQDAGVITAQQAADAYDLAAEEYDKMVAEAADASNDLDSVSQTVGSSIDRMLDSIITRGGDASDVLRDLGNQLVAIGLKMGLSAIFPSVFGQDGIAPLSYDGGGYTGSGPRTGGVDGKGGFPAILHPNETVIDHTKGQGVGGVSVSMPVNVHNYGAEVETRQSNGRLDIIVKNAVRDVIGSGGADKPMRSRFGVRPKPQGA